MPHLIPNLFEKGYTPYTAKLAPKNLWSRPVLGKSPILPFSIIQLNSIFMHRPQARQGHQTRC